MTKLSFETSQQKPIKLDIKDKKIIHYLLQNARMPFTEIAKKVLLSKESVQYRYHQLLKKKVILKTFARVNFEKLGFQKFHLLLLIDESKTQRVKELRSYLEKHPQVNKVTHFSDNWDFEIVIRAKTVRNFNETVSNILSEFQDVILKKNVEAVIDFHENNCFPEVRALDLSFKIEKQKEEEYTLDYHDLHILQMLCEDARMSSYKIAEKVALSADTINLRIKKLIRSNYIKGFTCFLNHASLGYQGYVFCFYATHINQPEEQKFLTYMAKEPHVLSVKKMIGTWDIKNYIIVKNSQDLHTLIQHLKINHSSIVQSYETWVIYQEVLFKPFPEVLLGN